jgi:hypothetical protein
VQEQLILKKEQTMSERFLYGAVDITTLQALAIGTNENKIKEFILSRADKIIKLFNVVIEFGKNYKIRLNIEGFLPNLENLGEVKSKIKELWGLVYMLEMDLAEANTEIYIFQSSFSQTRRLGKALTARY